MSAALFSRLWLWLGMLLESRRLDALAETCFRHAAAGRGGAAQLRLARLLLANGRYRDALPMLEASLADCPGDAGVWNSLGIARRECGDMPGARQAFERALQADPDLLPAWNNWGNWLLASGNPDGALQCFDKVLAADPDHYEARNNRVAALLDQGRSAEAESVARVALDRHPDSAPLHLNLGNALLQQGKGYLAVQSYKRALELAPGMEEPHFNLAILYDAPGHLKQAISFLEKEIARRGRTVDLLNRLAIGQMANLAFAESARLCREILEMQPDFVPAYVTLGNNLSIMGEPARALGCYQHGLALKPDDFRIHSNLLFELNYLPDYSMAALFEKHLEWARCHERPLAGQCRRHPPGGDRERRLRIGYVSPDFLSHPVGYLVQGVIRHHDPAGFEIHCYAHVSRPDHITEEIRRYAHAWHDTTGQSDAELAERIVADGIDILVDLVGHTAGHRLPLFARRPAPVQLTWLGYFHSTGMANMDYFITDPYTSPRESGQMFSETPLYLPHTRFCYTAPDYAPPVAEPPSRNKGYITFGSFNKLAKMSDEALAAWADILLALPDSRLWLKSPALNENEVREHILSRFLSRGVAPERLTLMPASGHQAMLDEYREVDIALDPFPFSGGITTFEALWMGVPVVTLARGGVVGRQSASALMNLDLSELVHETVPDYVAGALALAHDRRRLAELRHALRLRMAASALCDILGFVGHLEGLYRDMWHAWCAGTKLPGALPARSSPGFDALDISD